MVSLCGPSPWPVSSAGVEQPAHPCPCLRARFSRTPASPPPTLRVLRRLTAALPPFRAPHEYPAGDVTDRHAAETSTEVGEPLPQAVGWEGAGPLPGGERGSCLGSLTALKQLLLKLTV